MYEAGHGVSSHGIATLEAMLGRTEYEKAVANFDAFVDRQLEDVPLSSEDPGQLQRYVTYSDLTLDDLVEITDVADSPQTRELLKTTEAEQVKYREQHKDNLQPRDSFDGSTHVLVELYEHITTRYGQVRTTKRKRRDRPVCYERCWLPWLWRRRVRPSGGSWWGAVRD